jgi:hypothetical protein
MDNLALQLARRFQPRHVLIVLAAVMASFLVLDFGDAHGFSSLRFFDLNDSDVSNRIGLASMTIGALFVMAGAIAFSSARVAGTSRASFWLKAGSVMFVLVGVEEILGIHSWANQHGVHWNVSYLPFLAVATIAWFELTRHIETPAARHLSLLAIGAFLASCLFDAARAGEDHAYAIGELLEMGAAALFVLSMVVHAHAYHTPRPEEQGRPGDLAAIAAFISRLDPIKLALGAAAIVFVLGVMGAVSHSVDYMRVFDVNKEQNYASMFSGLALWAAALMAICNGIFRSADRAQRRWWLALVFVFLYLGLDEMTAIHEEFQHVTGIWGQAFLAPVALVGVAAWFATVKELRVNELAMRLWVAGAALWVVSQGIDLVLNEPLPWTTIPEELGEMTGSLLFAFSLLVALRPLVAELAPAARPAPVPPAATQELQPAR